MKFFDFFAGIGGFRLGMEMAGHECVGHCEIDKYAHMSYVAMHKPKESEVYFGDIRTVDPWDIPECDIYCGGFPCQAFSIAGRRRGFEDTRGTLFFEVMRIARERHPRLIFLENVKGLLNHEGGDTFETIITTMAELGYGVEWQVLNSKYFGVPQNRERVFIIGHLGGIGGRQIFPLTKDDRTAVELSRYNDHTMSESGMIIATDRQTDSNIQYFSERRQKEHRSISDDERIGNESKWISFKGGTHINQEPIKTNVSSTLDTNCGCVPGFCANYVMTKDENI